MIEKETISQPWGSAPLGAKSGNMKQRLLFLLVGLLALTLTTSCQKKDDTITCTVYWQLYQQPKHTTPEAIERAFQHSFFGFWHKVNDNTVRVEHTTPGDVRSLTRRLAQLADNTITEKLDPELGYQVEVKVFIDFNGSYVEEVWSKVYE